MGRNQELQTLYSVITFLWETLKKYDYRTMTEKEWDELMADLENKFQDLKKIDYPIAYLYEHTMFSVIDYMSPKKRAEFYARKFS